MRWIVLFLVFAQIVSAQTWEDYANKRLDMYQRMQVERDARRAGMSVWDYLKQLNSGGSSQQSSAASGASEAERFLADAYNRVDREKGRLSILIQQAEYASDVVRLLADHPYGSLSPEAEGAYEAKIDVLMKQGRICRDGESEQEIAALEATVSQKRNELAQQIAQAEATLQTTSSAAASGGSSFNSAPQRQLRKTERSQMEQAVWNAGLVGHRYDARKLTDEELINLHQRAQPVLELQQTKQAADAARSEAEQARREAERALQEAQRARQGW
jgi:hypothetical protein